MEGSAIYAPGAQGESVGEDALEALAALLPRLAAASLDDVLPDLVRVTAHATGSDVVIARVAADGSTLVARAVHSASAALAAELEGSRAAAADVGTGEVEVGGGDGARVPAPLRRAAARANADFVHVFPAAVDGVPAATLELLRAGDRFSPRELALGRLAAAQLGVAVRLERALSGPDADALRARLALELVGDAMAASAGEAETAAQVARVAASATGAAASFVWRVEADSPPTPLAGHGVEAQGMEPGAWVDTIVRAVEGRGQDVTDVPAGGDGGDGAAVVTLPLGEPPVGALQLFFEDGHPSPAQLERLSVFAARAAVALRRSRRAQLVDVALDRSQTVIAVVSQAIARLSLAHTLETAVERISELAGATSAAVYLREGERIVAAASRGLDGPHEDVAERLLELALGPFRGRGFVFVADAARDRRLAGLERAVEATGIGSALLVPLVVHDDVIGALAVFDPRRRAYREGEEGLVIALSSQLAVAVQNARLHERTKELGGVLERTLESERQAGRQLRALYDILRSFTESLSLDATLDAIAKTMIELFDLDAAAIRLPDERGHQLEARAVHVADPSLADAARLVLGPPQPMTAPLARHLLASAEPVILTPERVRRSDAHRPLEPFLLKGATAAVLPMTATGEVLGTITLLSLDPSRPLERETVEAAMSVTPHAALAIDNARLYQQQKDFSDEMQRTLLPQELPSVAGLEVGHVYQSSARLDVGGDVYDFLSLDGGRLAVVLGDVAGKGIRAAADMALAKFAFRALARSHPDPAAFLAHANDVVFEEIALGKFITMLYVLVDPSARELACASAGHPPLRVVAPDGTVTAIAAGGLALGIEPGEEYPEERLELVPGASVVLYTDGVIEARRRGELYGEARLDELLRTHRALSAQELAEAILADCRAFSGGDLADDCAVVVLRLAQ